jgi:P4 family phage/plasmid primase-like protien
MSLSLEQIKELARNPRYLDHPTGLTFVQKLADLKNECELELKREEAATSGPVTFVPDSNASYVKADPNKMDKVFKRCRVMAAIQKKSETGESIGHKDRVALGTVLTAFDDTGKARVHKILEKQGNYNKEKTQYYLDSMAESAYKPELCRTICGESNLCPAIKSVNRRSPIAFTYTYDPAIDTRITSFIETYAVEKVISHFDNLVYSSNDQSFYIYKAGVYLQKKDDDVKCVLETFLPYYWPKDLITNTRLNAVIERMKTQPPMRFEGRFNADTNRINLENGIYNLETHKLEPHSKSFMSNIQLPFSYDPSAKCPEFDRFILEILGRNIQVVNYVMNIWAYLLLPTYSFQKVWVWHGTGRNGKGTLVSLITRMLGLPNVSNESIDELVGGRFSAINLKDKLVNFSSELKTDDVELAMLKKLSGGDTISADAKYKDKISFTNTARLIILANDLPRFSEVGNAVLERFEFINFPREYNGKKSDTNLLDKLTCELSGIFNRLVEAMPSIYDNKGAINFAAPKKISKTKEVALTDLSTVVEFIDEECEREKGVSVKFKDLYSGYMHWAKESGYRPVGKKNFGNVLSGTCKLKSENNSKDNNQKHVFNLKMHWERSFSSDS